MENVVSTILTASARDQGGIHLPNGEPSKSVNWSTLNTFFRVLLDSLKLGKSLTVSRCIHQQHGETSFLIEQIFVKRRSFESKSSFFKQKSFKKELLIGQCFVRKKVCPLKEKRK